MPSKDLPDNYHSDFANDTFMYLNWSNGVVVVRQPGELPFESRS